MKGAQKRWKMSRSLAESALVADQKTVAARPGRFAEVPVLRPLNVCGEVAERLKASVCETETRLSSNLDVPRKSFAIFYFPDRARWLVLALEMLFWRVAGTVLGTVPPRDECRRRLGCPSQPSTSRLPRLNCPNQQKERLHQEVRGSA
jgi:hypothetical protein